MTALKGRGLIHSGKPFLLYLSFILISLLGNKLGLFYKSHDKWGAGGKLFIVYLVCCHFGQHLICTVKWVANFKSILSQDFFIQFFNNPSMPNALKRGFALSIKGEVPVLHRSKCLQTKQHSTSDISVIWNSILGTLLEIELLTILWFSHFL